MEKIKIQNYGLFYLNECLLFAGNFVSTLASLSLTVLEKVRNFFLENIWTVVLFENRPFGSAQLPGSPAAQFYSTCDCKPGTHHPRYKRVIQPGNTLENIWVNKRDKWQSIIIFETCLTAMIYDIIYMVDLWYVLKAVQMFTFLWILVVFLNEFSHSHVSSLLTKSNHVFLPKTQFFNHFIILCLDAFLEIIYFYSYLMEYIVDVWLIYWGGKNNRTFFLQGVHTTTSPLLTQTAVKENMGVAKEK